MHFEILVEDASGSILLEKVLPRILGDTEATTSFRIHAYKGIGHIPKGLRARTDANKRILLDQLPRLLRGYGRSLQHQNAAVVVVVDQDRQRCEDLLAEMSRVLRACRPGPTTLFRIAIEEMEAWLLGDRNALEAAYPKAKSRVLNGYVQDSVCGTWELLADAVHPGGAKALKKLGYPRVGQTKCEWAERIAPNVDVDGNASRSFQKFRDGIRRLAGVPG